MTYSTVALEDIAEVRLGRQRSPKHHSGSQMRPYVRAANVGWSGWDLDDVKSMNFTDQEMETYRLRPGDLLLGEASGSAHEVGKPALWEGQIKDCAFQNTLIRVRPSDVADPRFLLHYFGHCASSGRFARSSRGVGIYHLGSKTLARWEVPLLPIEEQRRIAAVLDAADALRVKRREALAKLETLAQAIFIDMFVRSDRTFEVSPIGDLAASGKNTIRTGPFGSQLLHEEFTDEGIAVLGIDNAVQNRFAWSERRFITPAKYEQLRRYTVRPGDVLVTIMGTTGRVAVVPDDIPTAINTKHLCCITLDQSRCLPWFLWATLRFYPAVRRQLGATHGAVMPGLNMGKIKQAEVPVPPLKLQELFLQRLDAVKRQSSMSLASSDELGRLLASLQQRAFRGEL